MSAIFDSIGRRLERTFLLVAANSDYTCTFWFKCTGAAVAAQYRTALAIIDAGYNAWAGIFFDTNSLDAYLGVNAGAGESSTARKTLLQNRWYAFSYVRSGNNHTFYIDEELIGTVVVNIAAVTFDKQYLGDDTFSISDVKIFGFKEWTFALTVIEIIPEWNSVNPVIVAYTDSPLLNNANDISGNGHNWATIGAIPYEASPAQSLITNISALTAADAGISSLDGIDAVQVVSNGATLNSTVWWKFTTSADARVIGAWAFSGIVGGITYRPTIVVYGGPASAPVTVLDVAAQNKPVQFPVESSTEYFLEIQKNNNAVPACINLSIKTAPLETVLRGDIAVNDDSPGFPVSILSPSLHYLVRNFYKDVAASDDGDALYGDIQRILIYDSDDIAFPFKLYTFAFGLVASIIPISSGSIFNHISATLDKFYVGNPGASGTNAKFAQISSSGIIGTIYDLGSVGLTCGCGNLNDTIFYWGGSGSSIGTAIKRWDIVNNVALTDFVAGIANYQNENILMLADGTILISYFKANVVRDFFVRRYDAAGTILNTYNFGSNLTGITPKLARALDDPDSFWVWLHLNSIGGGVEFKNVRISDGSILSTVSHIGYTGGGYDGDETATPLGRFGPSSSCFFMIMDVIVSLPLSGIFGIVTTGLVKHDIYYDTEKAIPNPTFRTALIGE